MRLKAKILDDGYRDEFWSSFDLAGNQTAAISPTPPCRNPRGR